MLPPRGVAERLYANIQRWTVMEKAGHFAALEWPEGVVREARALFRPVAVERSAPCPSSKLLT